MNATWRRQKAAGRQRPSTFRSQRRKRRSETSSSSLLPSSPSRATGTDTTQTVELLGSVFDELKTIRRNVDRTRHEGLHHQGLVESENAMLEKALKHVQEENRSLRIALEAVKDERENGRERQLEARLSRSEWERKALVQKLHEAREEAAFKQDRIEQLMEEIGAMTVVAGGAGGGKSRDELDRSSKVDLRLQESILAQLERSKSMLLGARSEIANLIKEGEEEEEEEDDEADEDGDDDGQDEHERGPASSPSRKMRGAGQTTMTVHELAASQQDLLALSEMRATARLEGRVAAIESRAQQAVGRLQASQHALSVSKENASRLDRRVAELDGDLKLSEERRKHAEEEARRAGAAADAERRQRIAAEREVQQSRSEFAILEGRLRDALRAEAEAARSLQRWRGGEVAGMERAQGE